MSRLEGGATYSETDYGITVTRSFPFYSGVRRCTKMERGACHRNPGPTLSNHQIAVAERKHAMALFRLLSSHRNLLKAGATRVAAKVSSVSIVLGLSVVLQMTISYQCFAQEGLKQVGGNVIKFDSIGVPMGPWRNISLGDNTMHMALIKKEGDTTKQFVMGFKGAITGEAGRVTNIEGKIVTLADDKGNTKLIVNTALTNGKLVISSESGDTYVIYALNPNGGMIRDCSPPRKCDIQ